MATRTMNLALLVSVLALYGWSAAQQAQKPLTNDDVITMVKHKMPESVVVSAIQSGPSKFNTSTSELIRLHNVGVTEAEMNAMMAVSGKGAAPNSSASNVATATPQPSAGSAPSTPKWRMPKVTVVQAGASQELPLEKTQLATTKTKPSSMSNAHEFRRRRFFGAASRQHFLRHHVAPQTNGHVCLGSTESRLDKCAADDDAFLLGRLFANTRRQSR